MSTFERYSHMLMLAPNGRHILRWLEALAFVIGAALMLVVVYMADTRLFPVVTDWRLDYIEREGDAYRVGGALRKTRPCELVITEVMAVPTSPLQPRRSIYRVKPYHMTGASVSTGYHAWGPWSIRIPALLETAKREQFAYIEVVGVHRCHGLWLHETVYGHIRMEDLP